MDSARLRETVRLKDGSEVLLRPIEAGDAQRLIQLHRRLSTDTQYLRFFGPKPELSPDEAEYLAGVDFVRRVAIVASVEEDGGESIIAVGRFDLTDDTNAETAIVVRDDYHGRGLGAAVLSRLRQAGRALGLKTFSGEILPENVQMLSLLRHYGLDVDFRPDTVVTVRASIDEDEVRFTIAHSPADEPERQDA